MMETMNSDDASGKSMKHSRVKIEPNSVPDSGMDSVQSSQDGGQANMKTEPGVNMANNMVGHMDRQSMKTDNDIGGLHAGNDIGNRMPDHLQMMGGYGNNQSYDGRNPYLSDQQNTMPMANSDMGPPNPPYGSYGPQAIRGGYPNAKGPMMPNRHGMTGPGGTMNMTPNYAQHPRSGGGSQTPGHTPTLNQLLQNTPNPPQRFTNYTDYGLNSPKQDSGGNPPPGHPAGSNGPYMGQGWQGPQNSMSVGYSMQQMGNQQFMRPQVRPVPRIFEKF